MSELEVRRFLTSVWGQQYYAEGCSAFLAVKDWDTGSWDDHEVDPSRDKIVVPSIEDLYFAVNFYSAPRRRKDVVLPGQWLYADLDEVEPEGDFPRPTLAWVTSPGRYQALWKLQRALKPDTLGALNQRLTYFVQADKGGWHATKVLRVPGSYSNKHEKRFKVETLWDDGPEYRASDIYDVVKRVVTPATSTSDLPDLVLPKADAGRLIKRHGSKLSIEAKRLLRDGAPQGQRSEAMWKLQRMLLEAGVPANQVFVMVKASPCNKYRGQDREDRQLWLEIQRALKAGSSPNGKSRISERKQASKSRRLVSYTDFINREVRRPMWMVEGIWSESAHGVLAGEPKTYKSVISTDLAMSVASGTRFLDHFQVPQQGPVIMIQKENDEGLVQDRVMRIAHSKALMGGMELNGGSLDITPHVDLPVYLMNNEDLDLTDKADMAWIRRQVRKINPVLLILDPLYLMAPGLDENSAHEMTPVLERLLRIKLNYNCGTLIIHHFKKQQKDGPSGGASRISGTGVFHRWYESALLLERADTAEPVVKITPEHRGHSPQGKLIVEFDLGTEKDLHYSATVSRSRDQADEEVEVITRIIEDSHGRVTLSQLATQMGLTSNGAKRRLEKAGIPMAQGRVDGRRQTIVKLPD